MAEQRRSPRELAQRALRQQGLMPQALLPQARPGAILIVKDEAIDFPEARLSDVGERTFHPGRYVVLVQAVDLNRAVSPKTLLVVPCTASAREVAGHDVRIPDAEAAFSREGVVAMVSLTQPVLKSDLKECAGHLTPATLAAIQAMLLRFLGLADLLPAAARSHEAGAKP